MFSNKKILFLISFVSILFWSGTAFPQTQTEYDWFFLFYESEKVKDSRSFTIRPFYMKQKSKKETFTASLMPVVYWGYQTPQKDEWKSLLGLVGSLDYTHESGVSDYDFGFFPFVMFGCSELEKDRYFHLWPFGGTIKGKLAQDKITTFLFPGVVLFYFFPPASFPFLWQMTWVESIQFAAVLAASIFPAYVDYRSRDYRGHGILWPIIQWGESKERDDFRILPFYAHNYKKNFYDNYSFGMIVNKQRVFLKDDEQHTLFVFPFYGKRWNVSDKVNASTLLWPFFSYGFDSKRGSFELTFLWPFVQVQDSVDPRIKKRIFFPIYGDYRFENKSMSFITPLYFNLKTDTGYFKSDYTYAAFILFWYLKRDYKDEPDPEYGRSWRYFKIWPLFQCEWDDRGNFSFNMMSWLPFRDPEGYENMYQPFWTIYEYRRFQDGEKRLGLLLRLYYQRWSKDFLYIKMPVVFSYSNSEISENKLSLTDYISLFCYNKDKSGSCLSLLFAAFIYNNDREGRYIRLFGIPIVFEEGERITEAKDQEKRVAEKGRGEEDMLIYAAALDTGSFQRRNQFLTGNDVVLCKVHVF